MLNALVDYGNESDDDNTTSDLLSKEPQPATQPVKRKASVSDEVEGTTKKAKSLPKLESSLFTPVPIDDPSKHQGRTRSVPYVEGQFIAHVYVPVKLEGEFLLMLREVVGCAQAMNPNWHSLLDSEPEILSTKQPLSKVSMHLSLSRPVALRAHQRDGFRKEVRQAALQHNQFSISFPQLAVLTNDEKTRTFLCVEVGAGHEQLQKLSHSLSSHLASIRQFPYYSQPRFHISIAWILTPMSVLSKPFGSTSPETNDTDNFLSTITTSIGQLQETFSKRLLELGRSEVSRIEVKIGKEIHKWSLPSAH